jgi:hypothetical protein
MSWIAMRGTRLARRRPMVFPCPLLASVAGVLVSPPIVIDAPVVDCPNATAIGRSLAALIPRHGSAPSRFVEVLREAATIKHNAASQLIDGSASSARAAHLSPPREAEPRAGPARR